jgi:hypothetical protein
VAIFPSTVNVRVFSLKIREGPQGSYLCKRISVTDITSVTDDVGVLADEYGLLKRNDSNSQAFSPV